MNSSSLDALANAAKQSEAEGNDHDQSKPGKTGTDRLVQPSSTSNGTGGAPEAQQSSALISRLLSQNNAMGGLPPLNPQQLQQLQNLQSVLQSQTSSSQSFNLASGGLASSNQAVASILQQLQQRQNQFSASTDLSSLLSSLQRNPQQIMPNIFQNHTIRPTMGIQQSSNSDVASVKSSTDSQGQRGYVATMPPPAGLYPTPIQSSIVSNSAHAYSGSASEDEYTDGRRELKRAANRKSAQLSRKRKKQYIEELKDENDLLRRKEQILRSIPDLVVVFDSAGKICFVSESVSRFTSFKANELEGKSFWERLCPESARLLKSAFMDSLAARKDDEDTLPLGNGFWELRLVDKNGSQKSIVLNGIVHFAGDRPECVCSIRERINSEVDFVSTLPEQSVLSTKGLDSAVKKPEMNGKAESAVRISDSGNSSGSSRAASESGSGDE